jgi:hypothetical protein
MRQHTGGSAACSSCRRKARRHLGARMRVIVPGKGVDELWRIAASSRSKGKPRRDEFGFAAMLGNDARRQDRGQCRLRLKEESVCQSWFALLRSCRR